MSNETIIYYWGRRQEFCLGVQSNRCFHDDSSMKLQLSGGRKGEGGYPVSQNFLIGYLITFLIGYLITLQVILVMVRVQTPGPPGQLRQCNVVNLVTICLLRTFRLSLVWP